MAADSYCEHGATFGQFCQACGVRYPREDTSASFMEDELRYASERLQAVATQKARLESVLREAITVLSLANYPEYNPRVIAGEVSELLAKALLPVKP